MEDVCIYQVTYRLRYLYYTRFSRTPAMEPRALHRISLNQANIALAFVLIFGL